MHLRTSTAIATAALAIFVPAAAASVAPDPQNELPGSAHLAVKAYAGTEQPAPILGSWSENSFGASLPQTRPVSATSTRNALKQQAKKARTKTRVVKVITSPEPTMIVAPAGTPVPAPPDDACADFMVGCTDAEFCAIWGFDCSYEDDSGQVAATSDSGDQQSAQAGSGTTDSGTTGSGQG